MKKRLSLILCVITLMAVALPATVVSADAKTLDHVMITPTSSNLLVGMTQRFTAQGEDANNEPIHGLAYTWAVVNGGGTIDSKGLFTAGTAAGTFADTVQVTAKQGTTSVIDVASVKIFAVAGSLDHVVVSPETVILPVGGTQEFTAQGQDANDLPITTGLTYNWEVVNNGGTITNSGVSTAVFTAGTDVSTFTDTVKVTVTQNTTSVTALVTVIVNAAQNQNKTGFFPWGWFQGLKKGWHGLHFPPGWFKNGKANQAHDEITPASPHGKGNPNNNKNK